MKTLSKSLLALGLLAVASLASAQQGGGRMFRGTGMMGGASVAGRAFLLQREDVRADLGMTDEQKTKLSEMEARMREEGMAAFSRGGGGGGGGDRAKMMAEMMQKGLDGVNAILTAEQQARLKEIAIQLAGNAAVNDKGVAKDLGISLDQQRKIEDLQKKSGEARRTLMGRVRAQELGWEEAGPMMEKIQSVTNDELGKILTDAQKEKLKTMGGKPFVKAEGSTR